MTRILMQQDTEMQEGSGEGIEVAVSKVTLGREYESL